MMLWARVPIIERATNTGENLRYSRELLDERRLDVRCALIVGKRNMLRRGRAT